MCLGCAVYTSKSNVSYEESVKQQNNEDYDNQNYGD